MQDLNWLIVLDCQFSKAGSFRSPSYWVLDIMQHNKRVYRIDSRDGFKEEDLVMLNDNLGH
jgi:hypothetical protein